MLCMAYSLMMLYLSVKFNEVLHLYFSEQLQSLILSSDYNRFKVITETGFDL